MSSSPRSDVAWLLYMVNTSYSSISLKCWWILAEQNLDSFKLNIKIGIAHSSRWIQACQMPILSQHSQSQKRKLINFYKSFCNDSTVNVIYRKNKRSNAPYSAHSVVNTLMHFQYVLWLGFVIVWQWLTHAMANKAFTKF